MLLVWGVLCLCAHQLDVSSTTGVLALLHASLHNALSPSKRPEKRLRISLLCGSEPALILQSLVPTFGPCLCLEPPHWRRHWRARADGRTRWICLF
ncbi:hypothetical protein B0T16DRAFT_108608 [Cercophora newfieldiana]|uniref:Secreted protein n=1 Tax=Cercophora newfieldiana TaxID=92897 RepID=A0AA40CXN6_9PEZI|nr:hypothetical protein B0T16DRAFT_108608 [Cercophora newfieldiana]